MGKAEEVKVIPCNCLESIFKRATLVFDPSSREIDLISGQGTLLNRVTLRTGPWDAIEIPGMMR
jgi:hypothetical protein